VPTRLRRSRPILGAIAATALATALTVAGLAHAASPAQPPQPAQGPVTWQDQVDNLTPEGHVWGFDTYYPNRLQAHAGDTVTWTVANNPNAFHTVTLAPAGATPAMAFPGFVGPDTDEPGKANFTFFVGEPAAPCGRASQAPCAFDGTTMVNSGILVPPPPPEVGGGQGNLTFTATLSPRLAPGTYYFFCLVHGPDMSGSIDVLPPGDPAQSAASLAADAQRQYQADLLSLSNAAVAIQTPTMTPNGDGTTTWGVAAGGGNDPRLTIDEFGVHGLVIKAGDTVKWTMNSSAPGEIHTVTGFATAPGQEPPELDVFDVACSGPGGADTYAPPSAYQFDFWSSCQGQEESHSTQYAQANLPSGSAYTGGDVTSGILIIPAAVGTPGIPFGATYALSFPNPGTYEYACTIHEGMVGEITVLPR